MNSKFTEGLGREDLVVLARYPRIHEFVQAQRDAGQVNPARIAAALSWRYPQTKFSARWAESICRHLDNSMTTGAKD